LYVGNLPYAADSSQLSHLFSFYGAVAEARVVTDRDSGQSKGFAFVELGSAAAARAAITDLNGSVLGDRALRVGMASGRQSGGGSDSRSGHHYRHSRSRW
jgi:RNA recognition motif-containing protein